MRMAKDWDTTRSATFGESERLSLGGHVCKILNAKVEDTNGHEQLVLCFDIDEGTEYDGFFRRQFDGIKTRGNGISIPNWPNGGTYRQFTRDYKDQEKTNPFFKGLITAVVESNPGYAWDWNERSLAGKYIGFVFGEEEYVNRDGEVKVTTRARYCCTAADAPDKEPPKLKELKNRPAAKPSDSFVEVDDSELPF